MRFASGYLAALIFISFIVATPAPATARSVAYGAQDMGDLKNIGQAMLIYAIDHKDRLPPADDAWDMASQLASHCGLDDARVWQSSIDPATASTHHKKLTVLAPRHQNSTPQLNPKFRELKLSYAVPIGPIRVNLPATTPIAWTRGLQPDGTWAAHSPYGTRGGYIMFLGGNVMYFRNLTDEGGQLLARDGVTKTANILDALPPGTRISEYAPTLEEQATWSAQKRKYSSSPSSWEYLQVFILPLALLWTPFVMLSIHRFSNKRPGAFTVLLWPFLIIAIYFVILG